MIALRVVWSALGLISGICLATAYRLPVSPYALLTVTSIGAGAGIAIFAQERRWREWPRILIILTSLACALPVGYWRAMQKLGPPGPGSLRYELLLLPDRSDLVLRGTISKEPEARSRGRADIRLRVGAMRPADEEEWTTVRPAHVAVQVRRGSGSIAQMNALLVPEAYGYLVDVRTTHRVGEVAHNPGEFDLDAFLRQNNLVGRFRCSVDRIAVLEKTRGNRLTEVALAAKHRFLATYKETILSPASRLVAAATLGTRRAVEGVKYKDMDIAGMFRHAGVGHVLAVSGLHVSVVSLLLYSLFRAAGLRPRTLAPFLILSLALFAVLTGARPSSVRAAIMNSVILIAYAYLRCDLRTSTYVGLALSSLGILLASPMVLFAPGFLLSYGAVLSLVLIAPTLDRWLCLLRGFSLFFSLMWFAVLIGLCATRIETFLNVPNCVGLTAMLWWSIVLGNRLNDRFPGSWKFGLDRLPRGLRLFVSAQLAIQCGMMIPLSAWFFGLFPVAGIFVNLVAIPAIGVVVQLGMLTGLAGLVPFVGRYLAMPFGAAASIVGQFFFRLAYTGVSVFPFPATPKPSLPQVTAYYLILGAILSVELWRLRAQGLLYKWWPALHRRRWAPWLVYVPMGALVLLPIIGLLPTPDPCTGMTVFAAGRYPLVSVATRGGRVITINAGDGYTGGGVLFHGLRCQGAALLDTAILTGPQPQAGNEGLTSLLKKMPVKRCLLSVLVDDPATYLEAIGDKYLSDNAAQRRSWATRYTRAYTRLIESIRENAVAASELGTGTVVDGSGFRISILPPPGTMPDRFVASARTALAEVEANGFRWLIVTDAHADLIAGQVPQKHAPYDVLVLPELSSRYSYPKMVNSAVEAARPRVVLLSGRQPPREFEAEEWAAEHATFDFMMTCRDGAILTTFPEPGAMRLRGFVSGREIVLRR